MKRVIIGALIGASVVPVIWLVAVVVSLLFNMTLDEASVFASMGVSSTLLGAFLAKMTA